MKRALKQAFKPKILVHCKVCPDISGFLYDNYLKCPLAAARFYRVGNCLIMDEAD